MMIGANKITTFIHTINGDVCQCNHFILDIQSMVIVVNVIITSKHTTNGDVCQCNFYIRIYNQ